MIRFNFYFLITILDLKHTYIYRETLYTISHSNPKSKKERTILVTYNKYNLFFLKMKNTQRQLSSSFMKFLEEKNRDLEAVFAYMDANRDGRISAEELKKSFKTLGEQMSDEEAEAAVKLSDIDGDGMLDINEFALLIKGNDEFTEEEKKRKIMEAFRMYIADGEDCITPGSLKMMLMKLGESRTTDDCKVMIQAFDLNADGVLSFDEFALMMR